ncbi:hypothetical protein ACFWXK_25275 [Streptomyces sp. NPDC059070]|uniref:hypothetical protein n=1 Tax=Streptomyces sp. NPDC059070 TaxID=3346713 RepID=UPI0036AA0B1D
MDEVSEPAKTQDDKAVAATGRQVTAGVLAGSASEGGLRGIDVFAKVCTQRAELGASLAAQMNIGRRLAESAVSANTEARSKIRQLIDTGHLAGTVAVSSQQKIAALAMPAPLAFPVPQGLLDSVTRLQAERTRVFTGITAKALGPTFQRTRSLAPPTGNLASLQPMAHALSSLVHSDPWQDMFAQITAQNHLLARRILETFSSIKDLLPNNLQALRTEEWEMLFAICEEDGVCLIWAPRTEHLKALLELPDRTQRQQYLVEHRSDIVDDVLASLNAVDHSALLDLVELARDAADSVRDGHDRPAQALLGNILDTVMVRHGHTWLRTAFPGVQFTGRSRAPGTNTVLMEARAALPAWGQLQMLMVVPALMVSGLMKAFAKTDREHTFNRHLAAHEASTAAYRTEFALSSLLIVQALLRQIDQHLYATSS